MGHRIEQLFSHLITIDVDRLNSTRLKTKLNLKERQTSEIDQGPRQPRQYVHCQMVCSKTHGLYDGGRQYGAHYNR
jgi:hypothetical protein